PRLALHEPEALLRQDEQINFVDGPVSGLELEVGPRPIRIVVGQTRSDEIKTTPFPLVLRWRNDVPAWRFHEFSRRQFSISHQTTGYETGTSVSIRLLTKHAPSPNAISPGTQLSHRLARRDRILH